jgi:OHCU decarboxylase
VKLDDVSAVFERSPWVAREAWARGPHGSLDDLHAAMVAVVREAPRERQIALIRAHPELGARGGGPDRRTDGADGLTAQSAREQTGAGLHRLSVADLLALRELNAAYRKRFGFPLVICVREHTPESIIAWGRERLDRSPEEEIDTALGEIFKIARARLDEVFA